MVYKYRMLWRGRGGGEELHGHERRKVPENAKTAGFPRDAGFELVNVKDMFDAAMSNWDDGHLEGGCYQASQRTRVLPSRLLVSHVVWSPPPGLCAQVPLCTLTFRHAPKALTQRSQRDKTWTEE